MKRAVKILNNVIRQNLKLLTTALILVLSLAVFYESGHAQTEVHDKSLKSYKLPPNLKKHLQEKYKNQIKEITSNIQETPQGPRGSLDIMGHILPKNIESTSGGKEDRARAIAKAFLEDEAELLGLPDLKEVREYKLVTDKVFAGEYVHIYFDRYIDDLQLDKASIHIKIGPDEAITYVSATLVAAPSELYQAVTKQTITEEEALKTVEKDLKAHGSDPKEMNVLHSSKFAIPTPPYAIWSLDVNLKRKPARWSYTIDAFTGNIREKMNTLSDDN
jgi:hypothetical protein